MTLASPPQDLVATHRAAIVERVAVDPGWKPETYDIELLADWDQERLPILAVNTNVLHTAFAPLFVILPSGGLLSATDKEAFEKIVAAAFPNPSAADAKKIAQLATMFGDFGSGVAVGSLVHEFPMGKPIATARQDPRPMYHREGDAHVVAFYAFNYERMRLYDCKVRISSAGLSLEQSQVAMSE